MTPSDIARRLIELAQAATPGPWTDCSDKCKCNAIFSEPADHPVADVIRGDWGDEYPSLRTMGDSINGKFQAYIERIVYGHVLTEQAQANRSYIAAAHPTAITTLCTRLLELERENERLTKLAAEPDQKKHAEWLARKAAKDSP